MTKSNRALLVDFEAQLPGSERDDVRRSVRRGIGDIEAGRFAEYDANRLQVLGKELVIRSVKKHAARAQNRNDVRL